MCGEVFASLLCMLFRQLQRKALEDPVEKNHHIITSTQGSYQQKTKDVSYICSTPLRLRHPVIFQEMNRVGPGRRTRPSRHGSAGAASTVVARWRESHWTSMRLTSSQTQRPLSSAENMLNHQFYCSLMWKMNFGRGGTPLLDTAS